MTKEDILKLRDHCEVTKVQFKERITDKYDVGCEMVAFCNSHGGQKWWRSAIRMAVSW